MEPAEYLRISLRRKIEFGAKSCGKNLDKNLDQFLVFILRKSGLQVGM